MKSQFFDGKKLKEFRRSRRLTIQRLAEQTGVARQTLSNWERGVQQPQQRQVTNLADFFECHRSEFYTSFTLAENNTAHFDHHRSTVFNSATKLAPPLQSAITLLSNQDDTTQRKIAKMIRILLSD